MTDRLTEPQLKLLDFLFRCDHASARQCSSAMYGEPRREVMVVLAARRLVDMGLVSRRERMWSPRNTYTITPEGRAFLIRHDPAVVRFVEDGVGLIIRTPGEEVCEICGSTLDLHDIPAIGDRCDELTPGAFKSLIDLAVEHGMRSRLIEQDFADVRRELGEALEREEEP